MKARPTGEDAEARQMLQALASEDACMWEKKRDFENARIGLQLAVRKFQAVRDVFIETFGINPYMLDLGDFGVGPFPSSGAFAFVGLTPGEAALQILREADHPMALDELIGVLRQGGNLVPDARTVNAALMNKAGVVQMADGRYRFDEEVVEEIPFE